jgi:hypothetical protein
MKTISQDSQCSCWKSNRAPLDCESEALPLELTCITHAAETASLNNIRNDHNQIYNVSEFLYPLMILSDSVIYVNVYRGF